MKGLENESGESKSHMWMDTQNMSIKELKNTLLDSALKNEVLRKRNVETNRKVEELSRKISACEEEKKMADWIIDDMKHRGSKNVLYMEDLRRQNWEASRSLEEFRRRIWSSEEEMKRRESENIRCVKDLRRQNLEASTSLKELSRRISACEEEKKMADRVQEEMKRRESENIRCVEDLRRLNLEANQKVDELRDRLLACEEEKIMADRIREEMEVRESDLRGRLSRAKQSVVEMKERALEACKAAEVNRKRFANVVPIAVELCKLLRMNVDDLVGVKDEFVFAEFGNDATTTHEEEGKGKEREMMLNDQGKEKEIKLAKMEKEIDELKVQKQMDDRIIEDLRCRLLVLEEEKKKADMSAEEMRRRAMEAESEAKVMANELLKAEETMNELRRSVIEEPNVKDITNKLAGTTGTASHASTNSDGNEDKEKLGSSSPVCANDRQTKKRKEISKDCCHVQRK
ncbi:hypothetical protein CASFOL_020214 [Castilleja foliolosa]|uniref:Uncharacterized protein n=1 Tax=Castilleja foliolosa TaxID=1961234 RepID=A0ABD3D118_9LAMI